MKKIIAMLAICGATFAMSAQNNPGSGKTDKRGDDLKTTPHKSTAGKTSKSNKAGTHRNSNGTDDYYYNAGVKEGEKGVDINSSSDNTGNGLPKTGISETTYQQTPEQRDVDVPEKVKIAFNNGYYTNDIKPTWRKEGAYYIVSFKNGSTESMATYDKEGNLISSERELGKSDYPSEIGTYFEKNPGKDRNYKVWEQNKNGAIKYYVTDNGKTTWFDKDGSHIAGNASEEHQHHMAHHRNGGYK